MDHAGPRSPRTWEKAPRTRRPHRCAAPPRASLPLRSVSSRRPWLRRPAGPPPVLLPWRSPHASRPASCLHRPRAGRRPAPSRRPLPRCRPRRVCRLGGTTRRPPQSLSLRAPGLGQPPAGSPGRGWLRGKRGHAGADDGAPVRREDSSGDGGAGGQCAGQEKKHRDRLARSHWSPPSRSSRKVQLARHVSTSRLGASCQRVVRFLAGSPASEPTTCRLLASQAPHAESPLHPAGCTLPACAGSTLRSVGFR